MYIKPTCTYYRGTEQHTARAPFLLLLQLDSEPTSAPIYGIVRSVALHQFGNFMMGRANLGGKWVVVSGAYGNDGLPKSVDTLPNDARELPAELWSNGGGWNSAGSEAHLLRQWAIDTFGSAK